MGARVQQLRDLLRLAASLRSFAEGASSDYARKLLRTAAELEARAEFLARNGTAPTPWDLEREEKLHAPVDLRI
jgi:hypothetical protein